jgi:hypothetical protein
MTSFSSARNPRCLRCPPAARCFSRDIQGGPRLAELVLQLVVPGHELPVLRAQPRQLVRLRISRGLSRRRGQRAFVLLSAPVLEMRVVQSLPAQQLLALRAALRQRVERRQNPRLVRGGERPALRPGRLSLGHLTIMSAQLGLVSECHRHCLGGPVSPCSTSKGFIRPVCHNSLTGRAPRSVFSTCSRSPGGLRNPPDQY